MLVDAGRSETFIQQLQCERLSQYDCSWSFLIQDVAILVTQRNGFCALTYKHAETKAQLVEACRHLKSLSTRSRCITDTQAGSTDCRFYANKYHEFKQER